MGFHGPEIIILLITVFWFAAFIHCIVNKALRGSEKVAWILFILFVNWIGALSYLIYWYGFAKTETKPDCASYAAELRTLSAK
jgi:hypothetical protein